MTIRILDHSGTTSEIKNFTKSRYLDRDYMNQEWQRVWRDTWLVAGLVCDVANTGEYFVFDAGREQILVTHTPEGAIQGFFNVCQHRGNRLVHEERGQATHFRCAYHAWTYDLAGNLNAVPYAERFSTPMPCAEKALQPVHTDTWGGMVFVNMGVNPPPLLDFLGQVTEHLAPYDFASMTLVEDQTVHLDCNWKAVIDNFSELYHVDFLHPQHRRMVDCCNDTVHLFKSGHTGLAVPGATYNPRVPVPEEPTDIHSAQLMQLGLDPEDFVGRVPDIRRAVQLEKRAIGKQAGFDYDAFDDNQLSDVWQYNLFPNVVLSFTPGHCWIMRARPHPDNPDRCQFDKFSLLRYADAQLVENPTEHTNQARHHVSMPGPLPARYQRPEHDVFHYSQVVAGEKTMTDTIDQDVELLSSVQAGMHSQGFQSTWLNDDEMRVQHFHNQLDAIITQPAQLSE